ncbi:hypothetical protein C4K09_2202 [Pseudomonas chlororaphis subsp. aureofaciens]|nr:hypothetical protein C4K09_2202 [Pseudomonas chlororaphis subsp. aureofaciens]
MNKNYIFAPALLLLVGTLAGCSTTPNVLQIHKVTSETIGLASTDELTMGPVTKSKEDFLGGAELNFKATTAKGRVFNCSTFMTRGFCSIRRNIHGLLARTELAAAA